MYSHRGNLHLYSNLMRYTRLWRDTKGKRRGEDEWHPAVGNMALLLEAQHQKKISTGNHEKKREDKEEEFHIGVQHRPHF